MSCLADARQAVPSCESGRRSGLSLADFDGFDGAFNVAADDRYDYGEDRFQARGRIGGKGYCVVFTNTATGIRLISFRRAHDKEMARYE